MRTPVSRGAHVFGSVYWKEMKLPEIVGIAGTNGAGKDVLGLLLAELENYHFVSASDLLRDELRRTGVPLERANLAALSQRWRQESGDEGILTVKAMDQYEQERDTYDGLAIVSLRHPEEAQRIKEHGGVIVWVDADQRHRYERLQAGSRGRAEDHLSFEEFQAAEYREMHPDPAAEPGALNMKGVHDLADITIENDFPTIEAYHDYLIERFALRRKS